MENLCQCFCCSVVGYSLLSLPAMPTRQAASRLLGYWGAASCLLPLFPSSPFTLHHALRSPLLVPFSFQLLPPAATLAPCSLFLAPCSFLIPFALRPLLLAPCYLPGVTVSIVLTVSPYCLLPLRFLSTPFTSSYFKCPSSSASSSVLITSS